MFNNQVIRKAAALLSGVAVLVSVAACGSASASNSSALEQVKQAGKIVFATEGTYAPFSYHDSKTNELTGYDVEVAKAIAKEVGIKAEFAEGSFDSLLAGVDAKKYDTVADQISATDERKAKYDFSEPYTYSYGVVITSKENPKNVTSFDDVKGLRAAETGTSNWNKTAQEKGATIVQVNDRSAGRCHHVRSCRCVIERWPCCARLPEAEAGCGHQDCRQVREDSGRLPAVPQGQR